MLYTTNPRLSSSLRYNIRDETRPEGRDAVLRLTVYGSGICAETASEYQVWNWVSGEGERSEMERVPLVNWEAWAGEEEVGEALMSPGATGIST